jgi:hypothetical protein
MTLRKLTAAAVFTIAAGLALPAAAEAGHRHSRSCGHRYYDSGRYDRHDRYRPVYRSYDRYYDSGYRYGYYDAYPRTYYRPYRYSRPYRYPAPIYRYHSRPRVSIHLDF